MTILPIVIGPDPRLKEAAKTVEQVDDIIRELFDDMLETMYQARGVGLAAVQVGIMKRLIVIDIADDEEKKPIYMANPEIINFSEEEIIRNEGCLSFPGQRLDIKRPIMVTVKFLDYHNNEQVLEFTDWLATAIQHEIDHLDGRLLVDYLSNIKRNVAMRKLQKLKKLKNSFL